MNQFVHNSILYNDLVFQMKIVRKLLRFNIIKDIQHAGCNSLRSNITK